MARNEWHRWGRGGCEGYSLGIGSSYARFHASVVRSIYDHDLKRHTWSSSINGKDGRQHLTRAEAMARIEHELSLDAECFVPEYEEYKAHREKNKFSREVDEARRAQRSNSAVKD